VTSLRSTAHVAPSYAGWHLLLSDQRIRSLPTTGHSIVDDCETFVSRWRRQLRGRASGHRMNPWHELPQKFKQAQKKIACSELTQWYWGDHELRLTRKDRKVNMVLSTPARYILRELMRVKSQPLAQW